MIKFHEMAPSISDQTIDFLADVDGKSVVCKVTYEFLQDIRPELREQRIIELFRINSDKIYDMMEEKLLNKEEPILTTVDLK